MNIKSNYYSTPLSAPSLPLPTVTKTLSPIVKATLWISGIMAVSALIWSILTAAGVPDPQASGTVPGTAFFDIAVLVFREGLESVLVLATLTAGMKSMASQIHRPIATGVVIGLLLTVATWLLAIGLINKLTAHFSIIRLQAVTGLIAIIVLLTIMNWFFHKVYWGGWITMHNRRKRALLTGAASASNGKIKIFLGFLLLGFTSVYREGVEVVLFLQTYRLEWGGTVVLGGALVGLMLTAGVGVITFVAQHRLPYRRMLIVTGVLLGFVLLVSVGEQAQEMQLDHWIPTTTIPWLRAWMPAWSGLWLSFFPTVETITAQMLACILIIGSYFGARKLTAISADLKRV